MMSLHANDIMQRQIRQLSKQTTNEIRASSNIGSIQRAVEELVRNANTHGRAACIQVSYQVHPQRGSNILQICDDGIGISENALKNHIGEIHCSSSSQMPYSEKIQTSSPYFSRYSTEKCQQEDNVYTTNAFSNGASLLSLVHLSRQVSIVSRNYVKKFRDGKPVSFQSTKQKQLNMCQMNQFTTNVTLYGLFYRYAVRRKHEQFRRHHNRSSESNHVSRSEIFQLRNCLRLLALAYPQVTVRFYRGIGPKSHLVDEWHSSDYISDIRCCIMHRFGQITNNRLANDGIQQFIWIHDTEEGEKISVPWRIQGLISKQMILSTSCDQVGGC